MAKNKFNRWRKPFIALTSVITVILVLAAIGELYSRYRFSLLERDADKVSEILLPLGAIETERGAVADKWTFGLPSCINNLCSEIRREWWVPVKSGAEMALPIEVLERTGFTRRASPPDCNPLLEADAECVLLGSKSKPHSELMITLRSAAYADKELPKTDVAPAQWMLLRMREAYYYQ